MKCSVFAFQAEYEEARKELQIEVALGVSIDEIREKLLGGGKTQKSSGNGTAKSENGSSQSAKTKAPKLSNISRKKWSTDDLFNRLTPGAKAGSGTPPPPRELTPLQKAAQNLGASDGSEVILKKFFKAGHDDLLVSSKSTSFYAPSLWTCLPRVILC